MTDHKRKLAPLPTTNNEVGYKRPPVHSRFKPGQSGNPTGRAKGRRNLKTMFNQILNEQVSLRDGSEVRQVSKMEAVLRRVVVDAVKGDQRRMATEFRLAEPTGHFDDPANPVTRIERVIVSWKSPDTAEESAMPGISQISKDEP